MTVKEGQLGKSKRRGKEDRGGGCAQNQSYSGMEMSWRNISVFNCHVTIIAMKMYVIIP